MPELLRIISELIEKISIPNRLSLAWDLDDTILGIWVDDCPREGAVPLPKKIAAANSADLPLLRRIVRAAPKRLLNNRFSAFIQKRTQSSANDPFAPSVYICLKPGVLETLQYLKKKGVRQMLLSASSQKRIDWICQQYPQLNKIFSDQQGNSLIAGSEKITAALKKLNPQDSQSGESPLQQFHRGSQISLAWKTPLLASELFGEEYDLLIDDSKETKAIFEQLGLSERLISVSMVADSSTAQAVIERLSNTSVSLPNNHPEACREDPYYWRQSRKNLLI